MGGRTGNLWLLGHKFVDNIDTSIMFPASACSCSLLSVIAVKAYGFMLETLENTPEIACFGFIDGIVP